MPQNTLTPIAAPANELGEGFDEIDAMDQRVFTAAERIRRAAHDPAATPGKDAEIPVTFRRCELEALTILFGLLDFPGVAEEDFEAIQHHPGQN